MPYAVETMSEADIYKAKWEALLAQVHSGIGLRDQLRSAIEDWGKQVRPEGKVEKDSEKRCEQIKAKVAALSEHFAPVVATVSMWAEGLKPLLAACSANLDGLPLQGAVDGVHMAFARAERRTLPPCPPIKLDSPESLEARALWLRQVGDTMQAVEGGPREVGAAIRALEEVLTRFEAEMESAKGMGRKGNTSALRWFPPTYPASGTAPTPKPPTQPKDALAFLYS